MRVVGLISICTMIATLITNVTKMIYFSVVSMDQAGDDDMDAMAPLLTRNSRMPTEFNSHPPACTLPRAIALCCRQKR